MTLNTMTPEARLLATLASQPVDRLVCAPWITCYAAQFAGISNKDFMWNWDTAMACYEQLAAAYPQWDCYAGMHFQYGDANGMSRIGFNACKFPGRDLDDNAPYQTLEPEVMGRDDLRLIKHSGPMAYVGLLLKKLYGIDPPEIGARFMEAGKHHMLELAAVEKRGQSCLYGGTSPTAHELFAITRSFDRYITDLFQMGDELLELLMIFNEQFFPRVVEQVGRTGIRRTFFPVTRTGAAFLNKRKFEALVWPVVKDMAMRLINAGITPIFHMDTDWGRDLENFLQFPKGSFAIEMDGETDIFRAREILGDHCALSGDVPATMLAIGTPDEVDAYCKKLITTVGKGGGFMLRPACTMPQNAKPENVRALFESVDKYGRYN